MSINTKLFFDGMKYSSKRKKNTRTFLSTIFSIAVAIIVALLVATMLGYNPIDVCVKLFTVGIDNYKDLINFSGALILSGLAFTMTSKAGIFNIGISGQMLGAGTAMIFVVHLFNELGIADKIPNGAGQVIMVLIAMIVGALFALVIGALEVYLKVNSVVSAILLNWIIYYVSFFLIATYIPNDGDKPTSSILFPDQFRLVDSEWGTGGLIPIAVIILVISISMFVIFKHTVYGHKIVAVGLNKDASQYAGYKVKKIKLSAFAWSGCISGLLACVVYTSSILPAIPINITIDSIPTEGFEGIAISLIANNNPITIIFIGLLFGLFKSSMPGIAIPPSFFNVLIGLIMIGATVSVLLLKWKPIKFWKRLKYGKEYYDIKHKYETNLSVLVSKYKSIYKWEKQSIYDQKISSGQKSNLWRQTKAEITVDYKTELMMVKDQYKQSLWKLIIDKEVLHEMEFKNSINEFNNTVSLKSIKKITKLKEKNYQLEMQLVATTKEKEKIKLQFEINKNTNKINLYKQINQAKYDKHEQLLRIKFDNNKDSSIKSKLTKDVVTNEAQNISSAKLNRSINDKNNSFYEIYNLTALKRKKKQKTPQVDSEGNPIPDSTPLTTKQVKNNIQYESIAKRVNSTASYLNNIAEIEQVENDDLASLKFENHDDPRLALIKQENQAVSNYKQSMNNADCKKLMSSLNYKYSKLDENGIGETSNKKIKKVAKLSFKNAKKTYQHSVANIQAQQAINSCSTSLEEQSREQFIKKVEKLKTKINKNKNERIKGNIINYLDGLIYASGAYGNYEQKATQEGGDN